MTGILSIQRSGIRLIDLAPGMEGTILHVAPAIASQLVGFGLYPGVVVRVRQTFPSLVIQAEETELAIEESLARQVEVATRTAR
jgi:Fe2+ transport system protein FeoA